jgi:hypothetical protein
VFAQQLHVLHRHGPGGPLLDAVDVRPHAGGRAGGRGGRVRLRPAGMRRRSAVLLPAACRRRTTPHLVRAEK